MPLITIIVVSKKFYRVLENPCESALRSFARSKAVPNANFGTELVLTIFVLYDIVLVMFLIRGSIPSDLAGWSWRQSK